MAPDKVAGKLRSMADRVRSERGPLRLLGLFQRDDAIGGWDVVVSGADLRSDDLKSFDYVAAKLRESLTPREQEGVSQIVILDEESEATTSFVDRFAGHAGWADIRFVTTGGAVITRVYVILVGGLNHEPPRPSLVDV